MTTGAVLDPYELEAAPRRLGRNSTTEGTMQGRWETISAPLSLNSIRWSFLMADIQRGDIPFLSVAELGQRHHGPGEVSPVEATEAYLERIGRIDGRLNSYITVCADEAREAAALAEREIAAGRYLGPLHGIPVAVKDQFDTAGIRTTYGSALEWDHVPTGDAVVVAQAEGSRGCHPVGETEPVGVRAGRELSIIPGGQPRNPWDLSRNPGISSSGSAAATAAFLCATALAEDTGGSTRIPAAWSGLTGLRPTWGLVSRRGVAGVSWSMDTVGPVSRSAEDCALTFQAIAGYDPEDPYSWSAPVPDYAQEIQGGIDGLRVGVPEGEGGRWRTGSGGSAGHRVGGGATGRAGSHHTGDFRSRRRERRGRCPSASPTWMGPQCTTRD